MICVNFNRVVFVHTGVKNEYMERLAFDQETETPLGPVYMEGGCSG